MKKVYTRLAVYFFDRLGVRLMLIILERVFFFSTFMQNESFNWSLIFVQVGYGAGDIAILTLFEPLGKSMLFFLVSGMVCNNVLNKLAATLDIERGGDHKGVREVSHAACGRRFLIAARFGNFSP